MNYAF
jgi:transposase InsO family protein